MSTNGPLPRVRSRARRLLHLAAGAAIAAGLVAAPGAGFVTRTWGDADHDLKLLGRGIAKRPQLPNFAPARGKPIRLLVGAFDPQSGRSPAQPGIALRDESTLPSGVAQYWLVQARDNRFADVARAVREAGASVAGFLPEDTYMVRATPEQRAAFDASSAVRWSGYYQPAWRVAPAVGGEPGLIDLEGRQRYLVYGFDAAPDRAALGRALRARPGVKVVSDAGSVVEVAATAAQLDEIAGLASVQWVSAKAKAIPLNANARWVNDTGVRDLFAATAPGRLTGAGQTAAVADTGINYKYDLNNRAHVAFRDCNASGECKEAIYTQLNPGTSTAAMTTVVDHGTAHRKMVAYFDLANTGPNMFDTSSHGSHTAGSVAGDRGNNGTYDGHDSLAPGAMLVHQNIGSASGGLTIPTDFYQFFRQPYRPRAPASVPTTSPANGNVADYANYRPLEDARTHNNSWGLVAPVVDEGRATVLDRFVWDHEDMAIVVSAGNGGPGPASILAPSVAKNDLSSGAAANGRQPMVSIDSMASFSSHGPTGDGRYGVDLATPGQIVVSVKGGTTDGYHTAQGTSMSGPVLTGLTTLTRQYFFDGYGPGGGKGFAAGAPDLSRRHNPSAALVKATLINGAVRMRGFYTGDDGTTRALDGQWPSAGQGFGRVNLDNSLYFAGDPTNNWYHDVWRADSEAFVTSNTGSSRSYQLQVDAGEPLDVTLAYTDAPDVLPAGTPALVNNLDVIVTGPGGITYVGNNMNSRATPGVAVAETLPGAGAPDVKNPVERVRIAAPVSGTYTITIAASAVAIGRQGFALAASGDIEPVGGEFTPGPQRQANAAGAPTISDVRIDSISANTAKVFFSTSEPTTAKAVLNLAGTPTTFVDSYNVGTSGFPGLATPPVETSTDYANKPVVTTRHEILLTGLAAATTYPIDLTAEDLGGVAANATVGHQTPARVVQANAADIGQLQQGSATGGWNTGTQLYAGDNAGNDLIGAFMFRMSTGAVNPAAITGAAVELTSSHNWVPFYTDDILLSVDLLGDAVEPSWGSPTQNYDTISAAPAAARVLPGTTHKRGAYFNYAFTFSCAELQALKNSLADGKAAFRYQFSGDVSDALFAMDFGFNRRSRGPDSRPKLVLFTGDLGRGTSPEGTPCDLSTPAPAISDVGIHAGRNAGSVTVSWETDVDSDSFVLFREQGTSDWTQVGTLRRTRVHHVEVLGLDSSREYEFVVRSTACNGETTTDTNGGQGYDFFRDPPPVIPTDDWFFHGTAADQANKLNGFAAGDSSLYSATFSQTPVTGTVPVTQVGAGANPDFVANPLSNFWIAPYSGTIKGDVKLTWYWSTDNAEAMALGAGLNVSFFADPDLSPAADPVQPGRRIGQATVRLSGLTPAPQQFVTTVPVDGTVANRLLIQASPQFTDTGAGLTVYYDSVTTPSGFQVPLGETAPTEPLPLTGPAPPPSAGATGLVAPPTRLGEASGADIAAGTGACVIPALVKPDLVVSNITTTTNKSVREGQKVSVTATVENIGNAGAAASQTEFLLVEENRVLGSAATGSIPAGGSATVSVLWDTRSTNGTRTIRVTADQAGAVDEWSEANNVSQLTVTVQGNKVTNGDFEQQSTSGEPAAWSGQSTGAGTASSTSTGGTDGSNAAQMQGNGGNAAASGSPTWTSAPVSVQAGEVYDVTAAVKANGLSSAPSLSLLYLGAAGQVLNTVKVLSSPLQTDGFKALEKSVTIPPLVTQVRVVLTGFAPTDLTTRGTVTFDDVGVFAT
jgi:CARDB protein